MALDIQDIFNRVMVLDNNLDLIVGGDDVSRGLTAFDMVTDWLLAEAATMEGVLTTDNLLYTVANVESTDWPHGEPELLRLDALWMVDTDTNRPSWQITKIQGIGNHVPGVPGFPYLSEVVLTGASSIAGAPREYAGSGPGGKFYWTPLPDDEYSIRAYGLWTPTPIDDATSAFPYPRTVAHAYAPLLAQILKLGLDRGMEDIKPVAAKALRLVLKGLARFDKSEPTSKVYTEFHDA